MLVLTPRPKATECLSGYLHSLATANGYERPTYVVSHLKRFGKLTDLRLADPTIIQRIAGLDRRTAERICMQPKKERCRRTMQLLGQELHVSEARMDAFRICPACVSETGRHEAAWHIRAMTWCPVHRIALLEACEQCGKQLVWNRPSVGRCGCGADLTLQGSRATCSESLGRLLAAFRWALYSDPKVQECPPSLGHLQPLDLYALNRFVTVLCGQVLTPGGYASETPDQVTASTLEIVATALDNWPHNFQAFLKDRYEAKILADRWGNAFRSQFDWAFVTLRKNLKRRGQLFDFLMEEIYRFGAQYISRERLVRGADLRVPVGFRWGSVLEAAAIAGIDPRTMQKKITQGEVPALHWEGSWGPRSLLVDLTWVRKWKVSKYSSVNPRAAAVTLDLPQKLLVELRRAEVFPALYNTSRHNGYSEEDIEIYARVLARLVSHHSTDGTVGGISHAGVSIRGTKLLKPRVEMMKALIDLYPNLWEQEDFHRDTAQGAAAEVEIKLGMYQHPLDEHRLSPGPIVEVRRATSESHRGQIAP